ncbi:MAG: YidC/Oxa1 family membrane protein insertase [Chloroflexota bacterium]|nr:YidC/Oxa1 family membrane protein insertase [Chloroflexota bacterium]
MSRRNLIIGLAAVALLAITFTVGIGEAWDTVLLRPIINLLILMSGVLFGSFGLAIIALTIVVRLVTLPLTLRQLRSTRAMQTLQPKLQEIQKKYAKDQQKMQQEVMRLYREGGVDPLGCLWPMLVQLPIWIALYQSILRALAASPEELLSLSQLLYSSSFISSTVPLGERFLWLNLAQPDNFYILPIMVAATMWAQQRMTMVPSADPRQQQMNTMMQWLMPIMFGFILLSFPSGLALYIVVSTLIGIVMQYFVTGWGGLSGLFQRKPPAVVPVPKREEEPPAEEGPAEAAAGGDKPRKRVEHGKSGGKRENRRRSSRDRARKARRKS